MGGVLATLPNYIMDPFWDAYAYTRAGTFYDIDEAYQLTCSTTKAMSSLIRNTSASNRS